MEAKLKTLLETILTVYSGYAPNPVGNYIMLQSDGYEEAKSLSANLGLIDQRFTIDLITRTTLEMTTYFKQIRALLQGIERTTQTYFIQEVQIDGNAPELWESEIKMNRKIISVTISYQI